MVTRLDAVSPALWRAMVAGSGRRQSPADAMLALLRRGRGHHVFEADHLTHQDFQGRYYNEHLGQPADAHLVHVDEPWFGLAVTFSDEWDQASFDPVYPTEPLESFEPLARRLLARPRAERLGA